MTAIEQPARAAPRRLGARLLIGAQLAVLACYAAAVAALMFLAIKATDGWDETTPQRLLDYGLHGYVLYVPMRVLVLSHGALEAILVAAGIWQLVRTWRPGGPRWTLAICTVAVAAAGLVQLTPVAQMVRVWMLG